MGIAYNTRIVRDQLFLYLDVANPKSYPGSGATVSDLSGNGYDATLTATPTYDAANSGTLNFSNANTQYGTIGAITYNRTNFSVFQFAKFNQNHVNNRSQPGFSKWNTGGGNNNEWILGGTGTSGPSLLQAIVQYDDVAGNYLQIFSAENYVIGQWYCMAMTWDAGTLKLYVDGEEAASDSVVSTTAHTAVQPLLIATFAANLYNTACNFACGMIYEKTLTPAEITQNFEALRGRFGI